MHDNESIPVRAEVEAAKVRPAADARVSDPMPFAEHPPEQPIAASKEEDAEEGLQDKHEESTMIDVHAPHGGLHTWKDFWIHLGTITLGLLIAISLEQSVEWVHHLHQRHQLEEDLRAEAQKNLAIMDGDYRYCDAVMAYIATNRERVDAMRDGRGKVKLAYLPLPNDAEKIVLAAPLASVWTTAKESQLVALLPRDEARFYDRVYRQQEIYTTVSDAQAQAGAVLRIFEAQFAATPKKPWDPIYPDLSRMSAEQLAQESALLTGMWMAIDTLRSRLEFFYAAETLVLHGGVDESIAGHLVHHPPMPPPDQPGTAPAGPTAKPEKP